MRPTINEAHSRPSWWEALEERNPALARRIIYGGDLLRLLHTIDAPPPPPPEDDEEEDDDHWLPVEFVRQI
jgi:hypothetical protein